MLIKNYFKLKIQITIPIIVIISLAGWSSPKINGSLDTTAITYSSENEDLSGTETNSRIYEKIILDLGFSDDISFHLNNRIGYRTSKNENPEQWDFNLYYGYLNYLITDDFKIQLGRIMDIDSIVYSFYDGGNAEYKFNFSKHNFALSLYGGLTVNDDYLEDENEIYGFNSFDYRNVYIEQRHGDYLGGAKVNYFANGIAILNIDYQMIYNDNLLAEHYLSLDFDTLFSKKIILFGYGTLDLVDKSPTNSLVAGQLNLIEPISLIIEHEYSRPIYIKDSFFWEWFEPYGSQQISGMLIYYITNLMTADVKYGKILYDSTDDCGEEVSANFEHRGFFQFGIKLNGEYVTGPEGNKYTFQGFIKRRIFDIHIFGGGGVVYYEEDEYEEMPDPADSTQTIYTNNVKTSKGYFGTLGADMELFNDFILSANGEYYNNPKYSYDVRGIFSVKYLF